MLDIPHAWRPDQHPVAAADATVFADTVRFTVLTPRLLRLEYSPNGRFEDRASQVFWHRRQPVPPFEVTRRDAAVEVETEHLRLTYHPHKSGFTPDTLTILQKGNQHVWRYGDLASGNLDGTTRTLDEVSGRTQLAPGLLSRNGWTVVDDSHTLVFSAGGWVTPRQAAPGTLDLYFFGYGRDYHACLRDYQKVAGRVPLLPRWALGNWWSRYWAYTQDELMQLMDDFRAHEVPLSVCIIDMDWHLVEVGREYEDLIGHGTGWTGYTWNRDLFPDPPGLMAWLHRQGLKTALNLHPADGVRPHEAAYPQMARRLGIDPATEQPVLFDIADPEFAQAYFELLHHPREAEGVDFWWIDWQQGEQSSLPGLDPLWWLNHLHFLDLGRDGQKRPFIFSRWGGLGNHRYPIGFSGDTYVNWETLAYQPYFTATAANVCYGWWSHDIGGHMKGIEDPELYVRWVQFGTFSPILRLHSSKNPFHERRPWAHGSEAFHAARAAMQLRHALIPMLYTLAWQNHTHGVAPIRPLYHDYPQEEAASLCPQQYLFGSDLIVAPFTAPADADTRLSRQAVWLPPGDWFDFFSGARLAGGQWHAIYGDLQRIPLFARAGAIVPLGPQVGWGGVANPSELELHLFAGADGEFLLYEDDGETQAYAHGAYGLMQLTQHWQPDVLTFEMHNQRPHATQPARRTVRLHIHGLSRPEQVTTDTGALQWTYDAARETLHLPAIELTQQASLRITVNGRSLAASRDRTHATCLQMLRAFRLETTAKATLAGRMAAWRHDPALLVDLSVDLTPGQTRALLEVTQQAGIHHVRNAGPQELLILWNNREQKGMRFRYAERHEPYGDPNRRFHAEMGQVPRFKAISPRGVAWQAIVDYFGLAQVTAGSPGTPEVASLA